ncbi:MAG: metallophosphoesterase [Candidatus Latescibacterota bacterium]
MRRLQQFSVDKEQESNLKILHTADIHLKVHGDERWAAFETVVRMAEEAAVSAVVISGDLFDRNAAAEALKPKMRDTLRDKKFQVIILPGNHDGRALHSGDYYGEKVTVFGQPGDHIDIEGVRIIGLPFEKAGKQDVIARIRSIQPHVKAGATNILLYHGELLDTFFDRESYGDEGDYEYMPARLRYFEDIAVDYVLAGHFHSSFNRYEYNKGFFVYPGSPVSITRRETGRRSVNLFEVGGHPHAVPLDTFHYDTVKIHLNPADGRDPLEIIKERVAMCHDMADVDLHVSGHVDLDRLGMSEKEFAEALRLIKLRSSMQIYADDVKDVGEILQNDLYKRFIHHMESSALTSDEREGIRGLVLEAFSQVRHAD